jgi:hypothetical protein
MRVSPGVGLILAALAAGAVRAEDARYLGTFVWTSGDAKFGGWSGFDLMPDGVTFRTVSDTGLTVAGQLERDAEGRVTGVAAGAMEPLRGDEAEELAIPVRDAEGLALGPEGSFAVSFEGSGRTARVAEYTSAAAAAVILTDGFDLSALGENRGIEALARADDGTLVAISEAAPGLFGGHRVYVGHGTEWSQPFDLAVDGTWRVTGADFGPDGYLYVLERDFWPLLGFRSRVLRMRMTPDGLMDSAVVFETTVGVHDNLEGIAVWSAVDGSLRMTMISDDNFRRSQRTELVDYVIGD